MSSKLAVPSPAALFRQASVSRTQSSLVAAIHSAGATREVEILSQQFSGVMGSIESLARRNHRTCMQVARFIERVDSRAFSLLFHADNPIAIPPELLTDFLEVMAVHRQAFSRDPSGATMKWRVFAVVAANPQVEDLLRQLTPPAEDYSQRHLRLLYERQGLSMN